MSNRIDNVLNGLRLLNRELNSGSDEEGDIAKCVEYMSSLRAECKSAEEIRRGNKGTYRVKVADYRQVVNEKDLVQVHRCIQGMFSGLPYVKAVFQGSSADNTFRWGWSDIDLVLIIKSDVDSEQLKVLVQRMSECNSYIRKVQPLQHHGIFVIPRCVLCSYPEAFMPPQALDRSVSEEYEELVFSIHYQPEIFQAMLRSRFGYIEEALETGYYRHHCYKSTPLSLRDVRSCSYQLFAYVNYLLLVPSIYMSAVGKSQYKGDTLRRLGELRLGRPQQEFLCTLNKIRESWSVNEYEKDLGKALLGESIVELVGDSFWYNAYRFEKYFLESARRGSGKTG